ncbi:MAG TPA: NAD(P)H-binding protein [Saprospiraceae bacterium]|nr:NAD(P)H-binding protein [Saprospiraceae bacterium]HPG07100.1 NAD(P)H-binding protein [Saprospiraceae bacterium]HPQ97907.1 NAD(P)H-binding protein [Saprospiraceae bacterium]HRV85433.1 NAD(P)H-binding protein [Saprospiraceae bacterium]
MKIILTGSLGNIGLHLTRNLLQHGHVVTVVSSNPGRQADIEALGAQAAIGAVTDVEFLTNTFRGADVVYLIGIWEAIGSMFDPDVDFESGFIQMANNYKKAIQATGIKKAIYLSTIGAHTNKGIGVLIYHYLAEQVLQTLPDDVAVKFMRPVGFYTNLYRSIPTIRNQNAIVQNFGGDTPQPWVSPIDIAQAITEEVDLPFEGKTVRYIASEEISANEIARILGEAIGQPDLQWIVIPDEALLDGMLAHGMNKSIANGFIEMQNAQKSGSIYADYYKNEPELGQTKFASFAKEFAEVYHQQP